MSNDKHDELMKIGEGAFEALAGMVAALELDYDRLEELRDERDAVCISDRIDELEAEQTELMGDWDPSNGEYNAPPEFLSWEKKNGGELDELIRIAANKVLREAWQRKVWTETNESDAEELAQLEGAAGDCTSQDEAREVILEDALSVQVRSDWQSVGEDLTASEFEILLTTGGPAVRIMGELNEHNEPDRAWLEVQDWGTPWTQYTDADSDVLLAYARCFYWGE